MSEISIEGAQYTQSKFLLFNFLSHNNSECQSES